MLQPMEEEAMSEHEHRRQHKVQERSFADLPLLLE